MENGPIEDVFPYSIAMLVYWRVDSQEHPLQFSSNLQLGWGSQPHNLEERHHPPQHRKINLAKWNHISPTLDFSQRIKGNPHFPFQTFATFWGILSRVFGRTTTPGAPERDPRRYHCPTSRAHRVACSCREGFFPTSPGRKKKGEQTIQWGFSSWSRKKK